MDRDEKKTPTTGNGLDHIQKLRLLVTLQNQIVEQARRNQQAQQDCADLSRSIVRETARRELVWRWNLRWLFRQMKQAGGLIWWRWMTPGAVRKNGSDPALKNGGFSSVSRGELAMAKSARNR